MFNCISFFTLHFHLSPPSDAPGQGFCIEALFETAKFRYVRNSDGRVCAETQTLSRCYFFPPLLISLPIASTTSEGIMLAFIM